MWIYIGNFVQAHDIVFFRKGGRLLKNLDKQMENRKKHLSPIVNILIRKVRGVTFDVEMLPRLYVAW